jgi:hypothetical protein
MHFQPTAGHRGVFGDMKDAGLRSQNMDVQSCGHGARHFDRPGIDIAIARDGRCFPADRRPVADDPSCSRLPSRRDIARGA